MFPWE